MPEEIVNAGPEMSVGQALAAPDKTTGQPVEKNSGQLAGTAPDANSIEELRKQNEELLKLKGKLGQELGAARDAVEMVNFLKSDPDRWAYVVDLANGKEPAQKVTQADSIKLDELEELGIPTEKILNVIRRESESIAEKKLKEYRDLQESDPKNQLLNRQLINLAFDEAEKEGMTDIRNYEEKIAQYYRGKPERQNIPLREVYRIVAFDDVPNKVKADISKASQEKRNASTEGPGMTSVNTNQPINSIRDAYLAAKKAHGK